MKKIKISYNAPVILPFVLICTVVTGVINFIFFPGIALCGAGGVVGGITGYSLNKK